VHICSVVIHPNAPLVCAVAGISDHPSLFAFGLLHSPTRDDLIKPWRPILMFMAASDSRSRGRACLKSDDLSNPLSQIYVVAGECERKSVAGHVKRA